MKIFMLTVLFITISFSDDARTFAGDVYECVHHDIPSGRFEILGVLYNRNDTCAMYHYLLDDELHEKKKAIVMSPSAYIAEVLRVTKVHDPEVCLIEVKIQGVEE